MVPADREYSLLASLEKLAKVHPLNPASEETLKGNAENFYCRTYITELALAVYIPEAEFLADWIARSDRTSREDKKEFEDAAAAIRENFYAKSLRELQTEPGVLSVVLEELEHI